ncbi:peptidyl-tRNA hydrolase [Candidatus Termititenax persephonae]|uniref:Peptidyl-tRNA hydrolase n=1 Tax=Candidatus Termititenax persephonae TaxID=2218525 RepID=A0A388TFN6_9BACT|nr:peptidyl-tRNA hydrolase [Candidatus Termititenax persephonae]
MKLIVGLGNPGQEYTLTRHNIGFMLLDKLAAGQEFRSKKFQALSAEIFRDGVKISLLKPQTFMNSSGEAVRAALDFYKISALNLLVLSDDLDQDFGAARFRAKGSSGGHNGLKSIIARLGHENFARVKLGIGKPPRPEQTLDYVLGKFTVAEQEQLPAILDKGLGLINKWLTHPAAANYDLSTGGK